MPRKVYIITQCMLAVFFTIVIAVSSFATISKTTTIDNLNSALKGETNASHKYELFAQKADKEGYNQVAKLFRAVSMAESIHRNNHKAVILGMGRTPAISNYDAVNVNSTKENLEGPLKGEAYEQDTMYPNFIKQADAEKLPAAVKTFLYAQNAEKQHEKLFEEALRKLGKNPKVDYCVSRVSGATYSTGIHDICPISKCGYDDEYIRIK